MPDLSVDIPAIAKMIALCCVEPTRADAEGLHCDWLAASSRRSGRRPSTPTPGNLRLHLFPQLRRVRLRRIDASMLYSLYATLLAKGSASFQPHVKKNRSTSARISPGSGLPFPFASWNVMCDRAWILTVPTGFPSAEKIVRGSMIATVDTVSGPFALNVKCSTAEPVTGSTNLSGV